MSICWYCYWGWAEPVAKIYEEAVDKLGGNGLALHYGPSHLVWEDENWDCAEWCLDNFNEYTKSRTAEELEVIRWSLEELIKIPLEDREIEPEDYDGENPKNYPPKVPVRKV